MVGPKIEDLEDGGIRAVLPIQVVTTPNRREHNIETWRRGKGQKQAVLLFLNGCRLERFALGATVHMVCLYTGSRPDDDNLGTAFKAVRDQIAAMIGIDDGRREIVSYTTGDRKHELPGIEITIRPREAEES